MLRKIISGLSACCLLAGCGLLQDGTTYRMQAKDVRSAILKIRPLSAVRDMSVRSALTGASNEMIRWKIVNSGDHEIARLATRIEEIDDTRTRVTVSAEPPRPRRERLFAESLPSYPKLLQLYQATLEEQIDAKLENRSFEIAAIQVDLAVAGIAIMQDQNRGRVGKAMVKLAEDRRFNGPDSNEPVGNDWGDSSGGGGDWGSAR